MHHPLTLTVEPIVEKITPHLRGQHPAVQSVVLADLLAHWIAAWPEQLRDEMTRNHIRLVDELTPLAETELFGSAGHPGSARS